MKITKKNKGAAIAETGIIPDGDELESSRTPWLWYMTWSHDFALTEKFNDYEALKRLYNHSFAVTLDKLPKLYELV